MAIAAPLRRSAECHDLAFGMIAYVQALMRPALLFILILTACSHKAPEPGGLPVAPDAFRETDPGTHHRPAAAMPDSGAWWLVFADQSLDDLIQRANRGSFTIGQAAARLNEARAIQRATIAAQWPVLGLSANVSREEGTLTNAASSSGPLYVVGGNLSYEADLFGRLANESKAAAMSTAESEELLRAARLLVQADIAQTYFTLRALDAERALVRSTAAAYQKTVRLTEGMLSSGLASELSLVRLRTEAESLSAEALTLDQRRAEVEHALAVLIGAAPSTFHIAPISHSDPLPNIPPGIPGAVLVRRPDVEAARRAMIAAQIRSGVAQDRWLPTLSLTAFGGFASPTLGSLFSGAAATSALAALLSMPIFDGGRYLAGVAKANADLDAAAAAYGQQILNALKDVEDQLSALRLLARQEVVLKHATDGAIRTTTLVTSNYADGLASQFELLDAQRNELRIQRQALVVHVARFQATVGLIKALGGGWDASAPTVGTPVPRHGSGHRHKHKKTTSR
jgi:outer membrane protein, multidrug efflux system